MFVSSVNKLVCAAGMAALLMGASPALLAQSDDAIIEKGQWWVSPMATFIEPDTDRVGDSGWGGQFGIGHMLGDHIGMELNVNGGRITGFNETGQFGINIDLLAIGDTQRTVAPYAVFGVGLLNSNIAEAPNSPRVEDTDNLSLSLGGGALYNLGSFPGKLRTEVRVRNDQIDGANLTDILVSAGMMFPFGKVSAAIPADSDGDGVTDDIDRCPNSPLGAIVDSTGCELDSDGDGVPDRIDRCPGTTRGVEVDSNGCALDSDGDGVPDYRDRCPNTPPGTPVGEDGCSLDDDGDGVLNVNDDCPNTPAGVRVDFRGCEIRDEISLPGVNFENNSDILLPSSVRTLNGAVDTLRRYADLVVECDGHTDSRGAAEYNQNLSQRRAVAVCDYLEGRGIDGDRLSARGYGESQPIASNETAEGRAANRRVTLKVIQ
ncbi:MAG: OmpA family protein [Pseudomonadota bacterium]